MARTVNLGQIVPNIQIGETTTTPPSSSASVVNVGTELNPILNFSIPQGSAGADAKINGVNTLTIEAGDNITLDQEGNILTINSTGGGTTDYEELDNLPQVNSVELIGNKSLNDLGIQEKLTSGTNIKTINNTSILGSGNINIEGGSGIKTLSISDYDYPTSNPTSIAGWLLEPNIYQVDGTNVAIAKHPNEAQVVYYDTGDIFVKLTEASSDVTNIPPQYIYTQRKNNDFAYYVDKDQSATILKVSDVVDNLTSVDSYKVLSAKQGKTLKDLISSLEDTVSHTTISFQAITSLNSSSTEAEIKQAFGGEEGFNEFLNNISEGKPLMIGSVSTGSNVINVAAVTRTSMAGGRMQYIYIQFFNTSGYTLHEIELTYMSGAWSAASQTSNLLLTGSNATITGKFGFNTLPESSIAPTKDSQLANKKYVDDTVDTIDLTDYAKISDIPTNLNDLSDDSTHRLVTDTEKNTWNNKGTYSKPNDGIPKTDLASAVQTSLNKADTAIQTHQDITGKEDKTNKVTSISASSTDTQYPSAKCVYDMIGDVETILTRLTIGSGV